MKLRDYQQECVDTILSKFNEIDAQIVQLPTGAGKTVILWHVLKSLQKRAVIVAPTRELTEQLEETGREVVGYGNVYLKKKSYWPEDRQNLIMTCQAATFAQKGDGLDKYDAEVLVVDEAHRSRSKGLESLIEYYLERGAKVLGLTATPERMDGRSLLDVYQELTYKTTLVDLIRKGYLVDLECYKVKTRQKIDEMKYSMGDLAPSVLRKLDVDARNEIILDVYLNRCPGTKSLVFCLNVDHAEKMADQFMRHGIMAAAIHGGMSRTMRQAILRCYKEGSVKVLCNCQLLTEGFDEPSIESLILARPTKSKTLYCQMVGRGVRPFPGKNKCLVYDLTDEIHNICDFNALGGIPPESTFEWQDGEQLTKAVDRHRS
jgi:superfamily II DNA or RNA helicase